MSSKKSVGSWWSYPPRKLGPLMTVVALSGLAMSAVGPRGAGRAGPPRVAGLRASPLIWNLSSRQVARPARSATPGLDSGIYAAVPQDIDNRFVVDTPQRIDDRMIVEAPGGPR